MPEKAVKTAFYGWTVCGDTVNKKGKVEKNPRLFKFVTKGGVHGVGYSINCKKVEGFGKTAFIEVACYGVSMKEAKELDLQHGEKIDAYGWFEVTAGKKYDFPKCSVNDEKQIRRSSKRKAKPTEL
jgi:hypothetical protein